MPHKHIIIFVTCPSRKEAKSLTDILLSSKLVACVSMIPGVGSKYWWRGKIEYSVEVLLILKTISKNFGKIEKLIKRMHSYEVPEIIALPIVDGSKQYLKWLSGL